VERLISFVSSTLFNKRQQQFAVNWQYLFSDYLIVNIKARQSFETSVTIYQSIAYNISEEHLKPSATLSRETHILHTLKYLTRFCSHGRSLWRYAVQFGRKAQTFTPCVFQLEYEEEGSRLFWNVINYLLTQTHTHTHTHTWRHFGESHNLNIMLVYYRRNTTESLQYAFTFYGLLHALA
jgi:hypothetical protein